MLARYDSRTATLHPYSGWQQMSKEIPVTYNKNIFSERKLMLSEYDNNYYLKSAYDLFEKIFSLPDVVFHPSAYDGYLPYFHINVTDFERYKSELLVRGACFISNVIVSGDKISGIFSYYMLKQGAFNRNEDTYKEIIQTMQRQYFIDEVLTDLKNI